MTTTARQTAEQTAQHQADIRTATLARWTHSMLTGIAAVVYGSDGHRYAGIVNAIEREDGSGRCFNVRLAHGVTVFVRL